MPQTEKKDIWYDSADGHTRVAASIWQSGEVAPCCVVQLSHGMCDYIARFDEVARTLCAAGAVVCGNDHLGHGRTATEPAELGYFDIKDGRSHLLADLRHMNETVRALYPGLPVIMLGHSMGSFYARRFAADWPELLDGLIISGSGGPNPLLGLGVRLSSLLCRVRGPRHRSALLYTMAFGAYLNRVENPATAFDWISRDEEIVRAYAMDPLCTFRFTTSAYHELFSILRDVSSPHWAARIRKTMPMLMIQGDADPVGDYGRGTAKVRDWLRGAGVENLKYIVYPGARHEVLNETNRQEVYADVQAFLVAFK